MAEVRASAPGKVNLVLYCGEPEGGYHPLVTVFEAVSLRENVTVRTSKQRGIRVHTEAFHAYGKPDSTTTMIINDLDQASNLAVRAAKALQPLAALGPWADDSASLDIFVEKWVPLAGGMAGGSADAAATLIACNELWELGLSLEQLAQIGRTLGADVPACVMGGISLGTGRGDLMRPVAKSMNSDLLCYGINGGRFSRYYDIRGRKRMPDDPIDLNALGVDGLDIDPLDANWTGTDPKDRDPMGIDGVDGDDLDHDPVNAGALDVDSLDIDALDADQTQTSSVLSSDAETSDSSSASSADVVNIPHEHWWVLAISTGRLSTPAVFKQADRRSDPWPVLPDPSKVMDQLRSALITGGDALGAQLHNDLEQPAVALRPELAVTMQVAWYWGALGVVLSGSGPTVALLAKDQAHAEGLADMLRDTTNVLDVVIAQGPAEGARIEEVKR